MVPLCKGKEQLSNYTELYRIIQLGRTLLAGVTESLIHK